MCALEWAFVCENMCVCAAGTKFNPFLHMWKLGKRFAYFHSCHGLRGWGIRMWPQQIFCGHSGVRKIPNLRKFVEGEPQTKGLKTTKINEKNIKAKISHWPCAENFVLLLKWMILKQKFYCKDAGHFCLIVAFVTRRHIHKFATGLTHHLDAYRSTTVQANPPIWMILLFSFKIVSFESPKFGLLQIKITD